MFTIKMQFTSKSTIHFSIFFDFSPPLAVYFASVPPAVSGSALSYRDALF